MKPVELIALLVVGEFVLTGLLVVLLVPLEVVLPVLPMLALFTALLVLYLA